MSSSGGGSRGTILLAEDDEGIRHVCCRVLQNAGFAVLEAADGRSAIDLLEQHREVTLVVADAVMPRAGGRAIFDFLQVSGRPLPFIFTTGYSRYHRAAEIPSGEEIVVLRKPYSLSALLEVIDAVLTEPR